jgi:hypothetical protein
MNPIRIDNKSSAFVACGIILDQMSLIGTLCSATKCIVPLDNINIHMIIPSSSAFSGTLTADTTFTLPDNQLSKLEMLQSPSLVIMSISFSPT